MYFANLFDEIEPATTPNEQTLSVPESQVPQNISWPNTINNTNMMIHSEENEEDEEEEEEDEDEGTSNKTKPDIAGKKRKQELHRRHSKRYRDNLGELFQNLEHLLPKVVPGCKLKTKSQIIANSVQAVKRLREEVSSLEMKYVLSSFSNRTKWVEDTVHKATCFQEVAERFMRLLVGIQRWKHSELWCRYEVKTLPDGQDSGLPVENPTNSINDFGPISSSKFFLKLERTASVHDVTATTIPKEYKLFSDLSQLRTFVVGDDSMVGRIASSLYPELIDLNDPDMCKGFKRAEPARQCGFTTCVAVPFLIRGHVFDTVLFYDDKNRPNADPDIGIAQDLSSSLGNCYGASVAAKKDETSEPN